MRTSNAKAEWNGGLKGGNGKMLLGGVDDRSSAFPFSFNSRMEGGKGSSPEELLAGALAGCYSMALSGDLEKAGFPAQQVVSSATANFDNGSGKWTVEFIDLQVQANVPGIEDAKFQEVANGTKSACPVARALAAVKINLSAKLV